MITPGLEAPCTKKERRGVGPRGDVGGGGLLHPTVKTTTPQPRRRPPPRSRSCTPTANRPGEHGTDERCRHLGTWLIRPPRPVLNEAAQERPARSATAPSRDVCRLVNVLLDVYANPVATVLLRPAVNTIGGRATARAWEALTPMSGLFHHVGDVGPALELVAAAGWRRGTLNRLVAWWPGRVRAGG